jgi:hypothetical protein
MGIEEVLMLGNYEVQKGKASPRLRGNVRKGFPPPFPQSGLVSTGRTDETEYTTAAAHVPFFPQSP